MSHKKTMRTLTVLGLLFLLSACSSGPTAKDDAAAIKASQAFLESLVLVSGSEPLTANASCSVPDEAKKPQPGQVVGPSKDWRKLVAHANACARNKDWRTLETLGNAIARVDMESPWGAYFLSLSAEGNGELNRAMWMIELAKKKTGGRMGLFSYQKGRLLFLMNETSKAMQEVEKALLLEPGLAEGHIFLADIYRRDMENELAQKNYLAALKIDPKNERAIAALTEMNVLPRASAVEATTPTATASAKSKVKK
jgi:hypothetical protein